MAIYKVVKDRILFPLYYLAGTGKYATPADVAEHRADKANSPLTVDERGNPEVAYEILRKDSLVYTSQADFDSLSDADKINAYYVDDQVSVNRYVEKSALYVSLGQEPVVEPYNAGDGTTADAREAVQSEAKPARSNKKNNG